MITSGSKKAPAGDWEIACEHYPDLKIIEDGLGSVSLSIVPQFRAELLKTKNFLKREEVAADVENVFLSHKFGPNSDLRALGRALLISGHTAAADELSHAVWVLGEAANADLLVKNLKKRHPNLPELLDEVEIKKRENDAVDVAKRLLKTQFIEDAEKLISLLGGKVAWDSSGEFLALQVRGRAHRFNNQFEMTQWVKHDVALPLLLASGAGVE